MAPTSLIFFAILASICAPRHTEGAFEAANQMLGYQASVHLMRRLVDCLLDAGQLYLHRPIKSLPGLLQSATELPLVGQGADVSKPLHFPDLSQVAQFAADLVQPDDVWSQLIQKLSSDLAAEKVRSLGDNTNLAHLLDFFGTLQARVSQLKEPAANSHDQERQLLNFMLETVFVLDRLYQEFSLALVRPDEPDARERAATETIKRNYAYLTQIITAYNLVFNQIDLDIGLPASASGLPELGAAKKQLMAMIATDPIN